MTAAESRPSVQPGEPAPEFTLPAASGEGSVSLAQYRGKSPVYLALFRGLYCSFCRRHVVHLGSTAEKLREVGVQTLGVVATDPERAGALTSPRRGSAAIRRAAEGRRR